MFRPIGLLSIALAVLGCAKPPAQNAVSQAAFFRSVDYQTWNLLSDALAVATEHGSDSDVSERIQHITRAKQAVDQQIAAKRCGS
jgi:hypothetical protein